MHSTVRRTTVVKKEMLTWQFCSFPAIHLDAVVSSVSSNTDDFTASPETRRIVVSNSVIGGEAQSDEFILQKHSRVPHSWHEVPSSFGIVP